MWRGEKFESVKGVYVCTCEYGCVGEAGRVWGRRGYRSEGNCVHGDQKGELTGKVRVCVVGGERVCGGSRGALGAIGVCQGSGGVGAAGEWGQGVWGRRAWDNIRPEDPVGHRYRQAKQTRR